MHKALCTEHIVSGNCIWTLLFLGTQQQLREKAMVPAFMELTP